jgi:DNA polymerase-3 subunit gamma/tau
MSYEVLARKWRPQQFGDVVGQDHVTQTLKNAITSERIAHAYLFVGPRGIGKTSVARIFAKALNCETGPTETPCDKCDSCIEIAKGSNLDVIEIDGASNNSVDQIRDLRETVKYAPSKGKFKVYIIDEVHMLSNAAFNALLKTLEEPPPHVKFIFATTEPEKILATIVSRCQRFDLRRIPVSLIIERLTDIAKSEGVTIDDDALLAVARGAEGGMRDAQSALDQLISFCGESINEEDVLSVFGLVARKKLESLVQSILEGDIKGLISAVAELDDAGKDMRRLVLELIGHFRNIIVALNVEDGTELPDVLEGQVAVLREHAKITNTGRSLRVCGILAEAEGKMRYALSGRTVLEMALIRCARAATVVSIDEILAQINELKKKIALNPAEGGIKRVASEQVAGGKVAADPAPVIESEAVSVEPTPKPIATVKESAPEPEPALQEPVAAPDPVAKAMEDKSPSGLRRGGEEPKAEEPAKEVETPAVAHADHDSELALLLSKWKELIDRVGRVAPLVGTVLLDASPMSVADDRVVIGLDPEFANEIDSFKAGRNLKAVERGLSAVLRREVAAEVVIDPTFSGSKEPVAPSTPDELGGGRQDPETEEELATGEVAAEAEADVPPADPEPEAVPAVSEAPAKNPPTSKDSGARKPVIDTDHKKWMKDPSVQLVLEAFEGSILEVRS